MRLVDLFAIFLQLEMIMCIRILSTFTCIFVLLCISYVYGTINYKQNKRLSSADEETWAN